MKAFVLTNKGSEHVCAAEIKELAGSKARISERILIFPCQKYEDICRRAYKGQSIIRAGIFLGEFEFTDDFEEKLEKAVMECSLNEWLSDGISFRAECIRYGEHDFSSNDIEKMAGGAILRNAGARLKVELRNPGLIIIVIAEGNKCLIGIDFAGFDLSNRE